MVGPTGPVTGLMLRVLCESGEWWRYGYGRAGLQVSKVNCPSPGPGPGILLVGLTMSQ